jgi:hypothetical protein
MTDWTEWHRSYDDPSTALARRLVVVQRRLVEAAVALGPGLRHVVSLCAGDGRDVIPILAEARLDPAPDVLLVELDPPLASVARDRAAAAGLWSVRVFEGDAADTSLYSELAPIDLLLLCGIFGNISDDDIRTTIGAAAALLREGGRVIWTRGATDPDLRPVIRDWVKELGFDELSFDGDPEPFGVGVGLRRADEVPSKPLPKRLFTFLR